MDHPNVVALAERAIRAARDGEQPAPFERRIPVGRYLDDDELAWERAVLFRRCPLVIAHAAELPPGGFLTRDLAGLPLIATRDGDGRARAFFNACRHRGTRLTAEPCGERKALTCPYHGWCYGLDGRLVHVPHQESFASVRKGGGGLTELPLVERNGLLWVRLEPGGALDPAIGPIGDEFDAAGLASHVVYRAVTSERRANWKLIAEAFLEGYHIRALHRNSIYPYFLDSVFAAERVGRHIRAATVRRSALVEPSAPLRARVTVSYLLFPSTVVVMHPDFVSLVGFLPLAPDRLAWRHVMLVPRAPQSEAEERHYARSFELIEGQVFAREDLHICEEMQAGLAARAHSHLTFGALEQPVAWFHDAIEEVRDRITTAGE